MNNKMSLTLVFETNNKKVELRTQEGETGIYYDDKMVMVFLNGTGLECVTFESGGQNHAD